jgi:hypothetical protein
VPNGLTIFVPRDSQKLPDNSHFTNRFKIKSQTSSRLYTIAQSITGRWWACSCRGWIAHKHCKHLDHLQLPGGYQPCEVRIEGGR